MISDQTTSILLGSRVLNERNQATNQILNDLIRSVEKYETSL
jgi:hypothetical protein